MCILVYAECAEYASRSKIILSCNDGKVLPTPNKGFMQLLQSPQKQRLALFAAFFSLSPAKAQAFGGLPW